MKTMARVLIALALTVLPTAALLAAVEDYSPPPPPSCSADPLRGPPWIICPMTKPSGCGASDWSMDLNIQSTGFAGCSLTVEGGSVGYWEMGLGTQNPAQHVGCNGYYRYYKDLGNRFTRCRSTAAGAPMATGLKVEFARNPAKCVPPTP